jgi:hypothetical protein
MTARHRCEVLHEEHKVPHKEHDDLGTLREDFVRFVMNRLRAGRFL